MRIAVVGHVEWVEFVGVARVPLAGEIAHGSQITALAAGGGGVAAGQLARWGAETVFFTAFGNDDLGRRAHGELQGRGITLHAATRAQPQRRAITLVDSERERTILVLGDRHVPHADDPLPWRELATCDAVYVTGGDVGAVRAAREARVLVATSRIMPLLREAGVDLDALVGSATDPSERYAPGDLVPTPHLVVRTDGARGGTYTLADGSQRSYSAVPTEVLGDTYGAGDTFAIALTFALAEERDPQDAIGFAAERAAEVLAYRGPFPR